MALLFAFIAISVFLTILAGVVGAVVWLYRKYVSKQENTPSSSSLLFSAPLVFPENFNWAIGVLLLGFHIGLYTFTSYVGPLSRVPASGFLVFSSAVSITWLVLLWKKRGLFLYTMLTSMLLSGLGLFLRANGFVQTWNFIFFAVTQVILFIWFIRGSMPPAAGAWLGTLVGLMPISFMQGLKVLASVFRRDAAQKASFFGWLKTAVIALVVLAIFLGLLSQADPVFAEIVREFRSQLLGRTVWSIVLVFLASLWWTIKFEGEKNETETQAGWLTYRDVAVSLSVVVLVIGIFLAVQFKYLFGGSRELLDTLNLTFSEYVRKGFTELLLAVFIGGILSYMTAVKTKIWSGKDRVFGRVANTALLLELAFLLLSALKRDLLYVETYGLTRVRVVGGVFLVWLTFFLIVLLAYGWQRVKERLAISLLWFSALLVLVAINVLNVDTLVANGAPGHHQYTDYFYLTQLSEDAAPSWLTTLDAIEADTATLLKKSELTAEDRAQLAGLKLGVLSFIENRDSLYIKYASDEWLLENYKQVGLDLPTKERSPQDDWSWSPYVSITETYFPSQNQKSLASDTDEKMIPKNLAKYRNWQFSNLAEQRAYKAVKTQEDRAFTLPQKLLSDILRYQVRKQVPLMTEENRLLNELQYQFIDVKLQRYWPQSLQPLEIQEIKDLSPFISDELQALEMSNKYSVAQLSAVSCSSAIAQSAETVRVYGVMHRLSSVPAAFNGQDMKAFELRPLSSLNYSSQEGPALQIITPAKLRFGGPKDTSSKAIHESDSRAVKPYPTGYTGNETYNTFVMATLRPYAVDNGSGCFIYYTSDEITAFYGLY